jgi:hypothetical protein
VEFFQPFGLAAGASPGFSGGQRESRRGRSAPAAQSLQMDSLSRGSSPGKLPLPRSACLFHRGASRFARRSAASSPVCKAPSLESPSR